MGTPVANGLRLADLEGVFRAPVAPSPPPAHGIAQSSRLSDDGVPSRSFHYCAFLSYGHRDEAMAKWLHESLEKFRVPRGLIGRVTGNGPIPARLTPIFRDRGELAASDDLGSTIRLALASSRFLIVLCSPAAATSRWTALEIDGFKKLRPDGCIVAAIVGGEPFANEMAGREAEECFPVALRFRYDKRGRPTRQRAEPIAADFREGGDGRRLGLLKVVAGMLGVGLDEIVQRENQRRQKRLRLIAGASLAGMAVTSTLAVAAFQARNEARDQRRQAEGLVGFMLGDLRQKLEPLGRLDALDSVGGRALAYYEHQDKGALSDEALAQRSRALTMMGEIASTRGDTAGALARYREALASTTEQLRRRPDSPQRLFDQAQNVFWVASIAWQRGQADAAASGFRAYKRLAARMIELVPGEPKYRLEGIYADTNLGMVLIDQRRFDEAVGAFQQSLDASDALVASDPRKAEYRMIDLEGLAYLSEAQESAGLLEEAIAKRERQLALIAQWSPDGGDTRLRSKAVVAHRVLGRLLASRGQLSAAIGELKRSSAIANSLVSTEPANTDWQEFSAWSDADLAPLLLHVGKLDEAASAVRAQCDITSRLIAKDRTVLAWAEELRRQCDLARAWVALARGDTGEASAEADKAASSIDDRSMKDADVRAIAANARILAGDLRIAKGDRSGALQNWQAARRLLPQVEAETPLTLARRAMLAKRFGQTALVATLTARLERIGYRHPEYIDGMKQGGWQ